MSSTVDPPDDPTEAHIDDQGQASSNDVTDLENDEAPDTEQDPSEISPAIKSKWSIVLKGSPSSSSSSPTADTGNRGIPPGLGMYKRCCFMNVAILSSPRLFPFQVFKLPRTEPKH